MRYLSSQIVKRSVLIVLWIAFYFMLIDVACSNISYGTFLVLWAPSFYYYFAGLAVVLGSATDYILRTCFSWYTTRFSDVFVSVIISLIVLGSVMFSAWVVMVPPPYFEMVKIEDVNVKNNGTTVITLNYRNTGAEPANVVNILVDGRPVGSYSAFLNVYDASGGSIRKLLNGTGYVIPVGKEGRFVITFAKDAFTSGQVLNISFETKVRITYTTSCRVP